MNKHEPQPGKLAVERTRNIVILSLEMQDDYEAILLYDEVVRRLADGDIVTITFSTKETQQ